jgi:hypothetical protein
MINQERENIRQKLQQIHEEMDKLLLPCIWDSEFLCEK